MSKQSFLTALGGAAALLFAMSLAQAGDMPTHRHKHTAKATTTRHVSARALRHSYARMPVDDEVAPAPSMSPSPNLFETGRPPAQPGQW